MFQWISKLISKFHSKLSISQPPFAQLHLFGYRGSVASWQITVFIKPIIGHLSSNTVPRDQWAWKTMPSSKRSFCLVLVCPHYYRYVSLLSLHLVGSCLFQHEKKTFMKESVRFYNTWYLGSFSCDELVLTYVRALSRAAIKGQGIILS